MLIMICLSWTSGSAQHVLYITSTEDEVSALDLMDNNPFPIDSMRVISHIDSIITLWRSQGYITAELDTLMPSTDTTEAQLYKGYLYDELDLQLDIADANLIQEAGLNRMQWIKDNYDHDEVRNIMDKVIVYLENNGYPFAKVQFDSVYIDRGKISAVLDIDKRNLVRYDTLHLIGDPGVNKKFLQRYLDIKYDEPYNLRNIKGSKRKIANLPYVGFNQDPRVSFVNGRAVVVLDLSKTQASTFDFIIGVLPSTQGEDRNFTITGEFTGDLYNELGYGEHLYAKFQRLRPEVQELDLRFNIPYLFDAPFGIDTEFGLYRNTNDFLELQSRLGFQYLLNGLDHIDASWYYQSSRLIDIDTNSILINNALPDQLDVRYTGGGVGLSLQRVDYLYNPHKGWNVSLSSHFGIRSTLPNGTILSLQEDGVDYSMAYDTISLSTFQSELMAQAAYYVPVGTWATIKFNATSAYKYNQTPLYRNELYRIGGNRLMRGFDEQSILTDMYAIATTEFRVILDRNSFLSFPFIDYGRIRSLKDGSMEWENALGIGIGLNFATGAGIFNISFAVGRRTDIPVDFNATKIHFGYVSLF